MAEDYLINSEIAFSDGQKRDFSLAISMINDPGMILTEALATFGIWEAVT